MLSVLNTIRTPSDALNLSLATRYRRLGCAMLQRHIVDWRTCERSSERKGGLALTAATFHSEHPVKLDAALEDPIERAPLSPAHGTARFQPTIRVLAVADAKRALRERRGRPSEHIYRRRKHHDVLVVLDLSTRHQCLKCHPRRRSPPTESPDVRFSLSRCKRPASDSPSRRTV